MEIARTYKRGVGAAAYDARMKTRSSRPFLRGVRDTLPLLPGVVPFGLILGVAARGTHLPAWLVQATSFVIFAGSAQFAAVQLAATGGSALAIALTGILLNLRHVLYSATLAPYLRRAKPARKAALAYFLTDEVFGVVVARLRGGLPEGERVPYCLGSGVTLWSSWNLATLAGLLIGAKIPASWSLDFAATLTFIALVVPLLADRASVLAALAAGTVAVLALGAPLKLGLVAAAAAGIAAGLLAERRMPAQSRPAEHATLPEARETPAVNAEP